MDLSDEFKSSQNECLKVAVNIRPLISSELLLGCTDCVTVVPGEPQVQIGTHCFTYDHVYGSSATPSSYIFEECVAPLVDAVFHGYNATVLAYGQTGSGKTYTMGLNYSGESNCSGIIPLVMKRIFRTASKMKKDIEFLIKVFFIEIFKEEVFDLLDTHASAVLRIDGKSSFAKPSRVPIQIRETLNGGITLDGVIEVQVSSQEEMALYLMRGSQARATRSNNMNSQSSRSHAIFTICLEQKRCDDCNRDGFVKNDFDDILVAKFHLVDLAGSERAKRIEADGLQLKEGIYINKGLLALGNVINALGDEKKRKDGGHVPYRDSKLTRLLKDSLGGNSKTVLIACISPANTNAEETINTLKYANRAKNIVNKTMINRTTSIHDNSLYFEELQVLYKRISLLEANNTKLYKELKECQISRDQLSKDALYAQVEKDKLILKIESSRVEIDTVENTQLDVLMGYTSRILKLETELARVQNSHNIIQSGFMDCLTEKDPFLSNLHDLSYIIDGRTIDIIDGRTMDSSQADDDDEKENEHSLIHDRLGKELQKLDKRLQQKKAKMKRLEKMDTFELEQYYEKKLIELEHEKKNLQKEIDELRFNLKNISSTSSDIAQKLQEEYIHKLTMLEFQVHELKKKQEAHSQLLRKKEKNEKLVERLHEEIQNLKFDKVQLQKKIKEVSKQFRSYKTSLEKDILQLKKVGRRNDYEMQKLMALNERQKKDLQHKNIEFSIATKKLKELFEAKKVSSQEASGSRHVNNSEIQFLTQAIEDELEVAVKVYEVRSKYERHLKERSTMEIELACLKDESKIDRQKILIGCLEKMSPNAKNIRITALENMLATSSSTIDFMKSNLTEAENHERLFSGRGRWNQVYSLVEAKNLMSHLFTLTKLSRFRLLDKEAICRERESLIIELKEKLDKLNLLVTQSEPKKNTSNEMNRKMVKVATKRKLGENSDEDQLELGKVLKRRKLQGKKN